jgi:prepilin-type N-terminal cleavage/methylation domain-containing protein
MTGVKRNKPGFTLMEMLLVVLIFSLTSAALAQIFVNITRLQRRIAYNAILSQDMRFIMEMAVRSGRNNFIDYSSQPLANRTSTFRMLKPNGDVIEVMPQDSATCGDTTVTNCLMMRENGGSWEKLTAKRVNVKFFDVYYRPPNNPFTDPSNDQQPFLTFNIGLEYMAPNPTDKVFLQAQSTVSSRVYQR